MAKSTTKQTHLSEEALAALNEFMEWPENKKLDLKKQAAASLLVIAGVEAKRKHRNKSNN